jgi:hypothetical protein
MHIVIFSESEDGWVDFNLVLRKKFESIFYLEKKIIDDTWSFKK